LDAIARYLKSKKAAVPEEVSIFPTAFYEDSVTVPKGIFFDKTHTWAFMEKDGFVKLALMIFFNI